jgi:CDP-diacylglycerol--glycerol-3-phosphate 3-phosphatidyltransferase
MLAAMVTRAVPLPLQKLPNAITIARFALVPLFIVLFARAAGDHSWPAGIVFAIAGVSDQIDGWLARRWRVESEFGKYADPLADRLMIDVAVIMLFVGDRLPWPALVAIVARDLLLVGGARFVMPRGYEFSVSTLGKTATWVLYLGTGCIVVTHRSTAWPVDIFWTGVGLSVSAAVLYVLSAWRSIRR